MAIVDPTIQRDAENLANQLINTEPMIEVARLAAKDVGVVNTQAFNNLRKHLTLCYAQGYIRGLRIGRERKVAIAPPMSPFRS